MEGLIRVMKNLSFFLIFIFCLVFYIGAVTCFSITIKSATIFSNILNRDIKYSIYLPINYYMEDKKYPVIYLFHGLGGDENEWIEYGHVDIIIDNAIKNNLLPPTILVMPSADPVKFYYINDYAGKGRWEDMFYNEFIPYIEKTYRVQLGKMFRGIAGVSMGGYGALIHALKYPQYFSGIVAFSPAVRTDQQILLLSNDDYNYRYGPQFGINLKGKNRFTEHYRKYDILNLMKKIPQSDLELNRYYINCGLSDQFLIGSIFLHIYMDQKGALHVVDINNGTHNWDYWRSFVFEGLKFITDNFGDGTKGTREYIFPSWLLCDTGRFSNTY